MVYDWENKEEVCYRLYIEEKKSLEEIMEYMKKEYKFTPRYATTITLDVLYRTTCHGHIIRPPHRCMTMAVLTMTSLRP